MTDLLTRIQEIIKWSNLGPAAFADEIGVARPVISHVLSGRNKPSLEVVQKVLSRFSEIVPQWLLSGDGEMLTILDKERAISFKDAQQHGSRNLSSTFLEKVPQPDKVQNRNSHLDEREPSATVSKKKVIKVILLYSDGSFDSYDA